MYKNIIFDFGGVVVNFNPKDFLMDHFMNRRAETCHLAYDESIFVDDNKANAQAAYNLGITGILYKNPKSFTRALGACGIEVE